MRSQGLTFGGLVRLLFASCWSARRRVVVVSSRKGPEFRAVGERVERVIWMICDVLFSLVLCGNRSCWHVQCCFAAKAQCFVRFHVCVANPLIAIRVSRGLVLRHASVCSSVVFVGPVVQSARFDVFQKALFAQIHDHFIGERFHGDVAVRVLRSRSEPSAHFGRVESLSLWRGAHFESAR